MYTFLFQDQRSNLMVAFRSLFSQHILDPEDGYGTFSRNSAKLLPEYTAHVPEYNTLHEYLSTTNTRDRTGSKGNVNEYEK
jgi:hypothetical protein